MGLSFDRRPHQKGGVNLKSRDRRKRNFMTWKGGGEG